MKKAILLTLLAVFYLVFLSAQNRSDISSNPAQIVETLNPNEFYTSELILINNGSSAVGWSAELINAGSWLTLDVDTGSLQTGESYTVNVNLDAKGFGSGDTLTGEIHFIFTPDSDTLVVPVTMAVFGDTLGKVINFTVHFYDEAFGVVKLNWQLKEYSTVVLQHFLIIRNGAPIATTQYTVYYDSLPQFGSYSYEVVPVYNEGYGIKRGPTNINWLEPELSFIPDTAKSNSWAGDFSMTSAVISNSGDGELYFEFTGFDDSNYSKDFVTSVIPFEGRLQTNSSVTVYFTNDASDYNNGIYLTGLPFITNETEPNDTLHVQMNVTTPSVVYGTVNDCFDASNLFNVKVQAIKLDTNTVFTAYSDIAGKFRLKADEGEYNLIFSRVGYQSDTVDSVFLTAGDSLSVDIQLCVELSPARDVMAVVNENEGECHINWNKPIGFKQTIYDDGEAEDFLLFNDQGSAIAVRFTPDAYPALLTGGMIYVGKGTETTNKTGFYGSNVIIGILDVDSNGMPGVIIDTANLIVNNFGWIDFSNRFNTVIETGDYFIAVWQECSGVNAVPIGLDENNASNNRSYFRLTNTSWGLSLAQGMMIRAFTQGPINYAVSGFSNYQVWRISEFDPNLGEYPQQGYGTRLLIGNMMDTSFTDAGYGALTEGWYDYCVVAKYNSSTSQCSYSNIIETGLAVSATVNVTHCGGKPADSTFVTLTGHDYPYDVLQVLSDTNGVALFDSVIKGIYDIKVFKIGYQAVILHDVTIDEDYTTDVAIQENAFPARNLFVDSITSIATWDEPLVTSLPLETFEEVQFPPPGWQASTGPCVFGHWHRAGPDENFGDWHIPPWEGYYALVNKDEATSCMDGPIDYLITPELDLREDEDFMMTFDRFFDAVYGGVSTIEYSVDSGITWSVFYTVIPSLVWKKEYVDLSEISGVNGLGNVMLAFVFNNGNSWTGGWAIDNVQITSDPAEIKNYFVYLDGYELAVLPPDQRTYQYEDLEFGNYYTAAVRAGYLCGMSEKVEYSWQSGYLDPPLNLYDEYIYNTNDVPLFWEMPEVPPELLSFNIYRNGKQVMNVPYSGEPGFFLTTDFDLYPGQYVYRVTGVYDLTSYGYPGELGESAPSNNDTVNVMWGFQIPFEETWDAGNFDFNMWQTPLGSWAINNLIGNKAPSVAFDGDTSLVDYSVPLISVPLRADSIIKERIVYLDFDLMLEDDSATETETLKVEVMNADNCILLTEVSNKGSFSFEDGHHHINITEKVMGTVFWLKFTAEGQNSSIVHWYVDNIKVYNKCPEPENLRAKYIWDSNDNFGIKICWQHPMMSTAVKQWFYWDAENASGEGFNSIDDYSVAAYWSPGDLANYEGGYLTRVRFYLLGTQPEFFNALHIKVWKGQNTDSLVFEKDMPASLLTSGWNEYIFSQPIGLKEGDRLWVGYTIYDQVENALPCGTDAGPANKGRGDKVKIGNGTWHNASGIGSDYDHNWNIRILIKKPRDSMRWRNFDNYKLYRSETGEEDSYTEYASIPYDTSFLVCYNDMYPNTQPGSVYWYKVTAGYFSEGDTCESDFARAIDNPDDDFVYVLVTDVEKQNSNDKISLYPNPASDRLNIESAEVITQITVYAYSGKIVLKKNLNSKNEFALNTATFHAGVYIAKIKTGNREVFKRFVIVR